MLSYDTIIKIIDEMDDIYEKEFQDAKNIESMLIARAKQMAALEIGVRLLDAKITHSFMK